MLIKICSYIKNKFKENNLSWRIVCPPGIIAGIIQLIRSLILYPSNFETPVEPLFIWYVRFSLSIIAILLGLICFFKPRIYYICTIPLCGWGLFMIYQNQIAIGFLLYIFGCFVYTTNNTVAAAALENWPDRVMAGEWVLLVAAEEMLGVFGTVLIGTAVSCAVLSGIMGFYLASSRLMYSMEIGRAHV